MSVILDETGELQALAPFNGECPLCHETILVVELRGVDVVVEIDEVLETFPCPQCAQVAGMGHRRSGCWRCSGLGFIGQVLPPFGIAVAEDGAARYFTGHRQAGEAVHREHTCMFTR